MKTNGIGPNKLGASKKSSSSPAKKGCMNSPMKQTVKQKKNLPKQIVDAIAAKSPAKSNYKA
tara:strand:- start:5210 stop:5395 length:186 start_codon:yes stop_codon:yes gene_type:complete